MDSPLHRVPGEGGKGTARDHPLVPIESRNKKPSHCNCNELGFCLLVAVYCSRPVDGSRNSFGAFYQLPVMTSQIARTGDDTSSLGARTYFCSLLRRGSR